MAFVGEGWDGLDDPKRYAGFRQFLSVEDGSSALRARRLTIAEELADALTGDVAALLRRDPADPVIRTFTAMLFAALQVRDRVLREAIAEGVPVDEVRRRVVEVMDQAFDRLDAAFADVDRPGA